MDCSPCQFRALAPEIAGMLVESGIPALLCPGDGMNDVTFLLIALKCNNINQVVGEVQYREFAEQLVSHNVVFSSCLFCGFK